MSSMPGDRSAARDDRKALSDLGPTPAALSAGSRGKQAAAFTAIYLIWGSTYLAIRFALESFPPLLMASVRFLTAGAILYGWARLRGAPAPTRRQWRSAFVLGALLFLGGNGTVTWSETRIASGLVALIISTIPVWVALIEWAGSGRRLPSAPTLVALAGGLAGIAILVGPGRLLGSGAIDRRAAFILLLGSFGWAYGSLLTRRIPLPASSSLAAAMPLFAGGVWLAIAGLAHGEAAEWGRHAVTFRAIASVAYLSIFGSIIAYSAYAWLLKATIASRVSTYAYVNPVVAVLLGAVFAGESLSPRVVISAAVIVMSVAVLIRSKGKAREKREGQG